VNELPIFISYRQDDAKELARWLHDSLQGRTIFDSEGSLEIPKTLGVYFDQATPPVNNWRDYLERELNRSRVLLVVCSPNAATERSNDVLYFEIRWWITNRGDNSPILITPSGQRWIPQPIKERWPNAQTINAVIRDPLTDAMTNPAILHADVARVLDGIAQRVRGLHIENGVVSFPSQSKNDDPAVNLPGLYTWEKDKNFRYIRCNENYSRAAGFDSPRAMIGKSDDDMPWRSLADDFRCGDQKVMDAESPARVHVHEKEIMVDRVADILVTENQILTESGKCVGVTGYFLDITGMELTPKSIRKNLDHEFRLGPEFGDQCFSDVEASVFKGILRKFSSARIAAALSISKAEVETHTASIMQKLQCRTLGDVIVTAIRAGLPLLLFGLE